tara:strand:+ start:574 stop:756 length:183 start_codon:yes stop_codon:yes gene_type:complete
MNTDLKEIKREVLENNIDRILRLTAVVLNTLDLAEDTQLKIAYTRIQNDAMLAKHIINNA